MLIPWQSLEPATLNNILENIITDDGSDISHLHIPMEKKVEQLIVKLRNKEIFLAFEDQTESLNLLTKDQCQQMGLF
jgi:uncharacterized protein